MPKPKLPVDLAKGDHTRTAYTANEYTDLVFRGYEAVEVEEDLTPAQKAVRTREANKQQAAEDTSNVPTSTRVPAGDAN